MRFSGENQLTYHSMLINILLNLIDYQAQLMAYHT